MTHVQSSSRVEHARPVVAVHQPNLVPRVRVMSKIWAADQYVVLDSVQFSRKAWQNRFLLTRHDGSAVLHTHSLRAHPRDACLNGMKLAAPMRDLLRLRKTSHHVYARMPHKDDVLAVLEAWPVTEYGLVDLAGWFIAYAFQRAGSGPLMRLASELDLPAERDRRLVEIARAVGGNRIIMGPGGMRYFDASIAARSGILVQPQLWDPRCLRAVDPALTKDASILDVIAREGWDGTLAFLDSIGG